MGQFWKAFVLATSAVVCSEAAAAKAVYLACDFPSDGKSFIVNITMDEEAGTATMFVPSTGFSERRPATFTADQVLFSNRLQRYAINRVDLSATRFVPILKETAAGKCVVQAPAKRAF